MSIRGQIKLLGAVALISMMVLSGVNIYKTYLHYQRVINIEKFTKFNLILNDFLEQVQKERSLSAIFITSSGKILQEARPTQIEAVNNQIQKFEDFIETIDFELYDRKYEFIINKLKKKISYRDIIREEIKNQKKGVDSTAEYFDSIGKILIEISSINAKMTPAGEVAKNLNGYIFFLKAKEIASQKLALFSSAQITENFSQDFINKMIELNRQEKFYIDIFLNIAELKLVKLYEKKMDLKELDFTKEMATKALNIIMEGDTAIQSQDWFKIISNRSNNFEQIDNILLQNIDKKEKITLIFYSLIFSLIAMLAILLSIFMLRKNINKRIHSNDWIFEPQNER